MMIKQSGKILFIAGLFILTACSGNKEGGKQVKGGYTLTGKISNTTSDTVHLMQVYDNYMQLAQSSPLEEDGSFRFEGAVESPGYYRLKFDGERFIGLILENKEFQLYADARNPDSLKIEGSDLNRDFFNYHRLSLPYNLKLTSLSKDIRRYEREGKMDSLNATLKIYQQAEKERQEFTVAFIDSIFPSEAVLFIYQALNPADYFDYQLELSRKMKEKYPDSKLAKQFSDRMNKMLAEKQLQEMQESRSSLGIGKTAPDIVLPDPSGNIISLSSLRGKYVLIDFWASWCGPCRHENPNVVRLYNKYKDKNFEIFGVSLDENKEKWMKAIQQDKLAWKHVSDLRQWQSSVVPMYEIRGIPFTVLLDPNGKIIGKNLRGTELERKLAEIFGQ